MMNSSCLDYFQGGSIHSSILMTMTQIFALMTYIMMGVQVVLQYFDTLAVHPGSERRERGGGRRATASCKGGW